MPTTWAGAALILLLAPGAAYAAGFNLAARIPRTSRNDPFQASITLLFSAFAVNFVIAGLASILNLLRKQQGTLFQSLVDILKEQTVCATSNVVQCLKDLVTDDAITHYTVTALALGFCLGWLISKLIVWVPLPWRDYYGPLHSVVSGYYRPRIIVSVVSRTLVKSERTDRWRSEKLDFPVMYRGTFDEMRLTSNGRIEYLCIRDPEKGRFQIPRSSVAFEEIGLDDFPGRPKGNDQNTVARARAALIKKNSDKDLDTRRLIVEGSEIQNVYLAKLSGYDERDIFRVLKQFFDLKGHLRRCGEWAAEKKHFKNFRLWTPQIIFNKGHALLSSAFPDYPRRRDLQVIVILIVLFAILALTGPYSRR